MGYTHLIRCYFIDVGIWHITFSRFAYEVKELLKNPKIHPILYEQKIWARMDRCVVYVHFLFYVLKNAALLLNRHPPIQHWCGLSNEILCILLAQKDAKLPGLEVRKKWCSTSFSYVWQVFYLFRKAVQRKLWQEGKAHGVEWLSISIFHPTIYAHGLKSF